MEVRAAKALFFILSIAMILVKFKKWVCHPRYGHYRNDRKALQLVDAYDGGPVATATVNLADEVPTSQDHVFIKDYSENEGMTNALIDAGLIEPTPTRTVQTGYVSVNEHKLTEAGLDLYP